MHIWLRPAEINTFAALQESAACTGLTEHA
jgi:hypothetical protein